MAFSFFNRRQKLSTAVPSLLNDETFYDPKFLAYHRKAMNTTMYGLNGVISVDIEDGRVKFLVHSSLGRKSFDKAYDAFNEAAKTNVTNFARITADPLEMVGSMRGTGGMHQRLLDMQKALSGMTSKERIEALGRDVDPNNIYFTIGSYKSDKSAKASAQNMVNQLRGKGLIVGDDGAFTMLRAFEKGAGGAVDSEFSTFQLDQLLRITSGGSGGILANNEIIKALGREGGLGDLFSKAGKRLKGALALKDISLSGNDLQRVIQTISQSTNISTLSDSIYIFDSNKDLSLMMSNLYELSKQGFGNNSVKGALFGGLGDVEKAIYKNTDVEFLVKSVLDETLGMLDPAQHDKIMATIAAIGQGGTIDGDTVTLNGKPIKINNTTITLSKEEQDILQILQDKFEKPFDGSGIINQKAVNSMKAEIRKEIKAIDNLITNYPNGSIPESELIRKRVLESQLQNLNDGNFEAITGRIFFQEGGLPKMAKAVFTGGDFGSGNILERFTAIISRANMKKETGIMGQTESINLVTQGSSKGFVNLDPLAPAFHGDIMSAQDVLEAQEKRAGRILQDVRSTMATGDFTANLKKQIFEDAMLQIDDITSPTGLAMQRRKEFAAALKRAIESGQDPRTIPQLANYLQKYITSILYREKDGMIQMVMEDTYRFSLDTSLSHNVGSMEVRQGLDRDPYTPIQFSGQTSSVDLMNFEIRGHKMLLPGDAAFTFQHSLGGFDLDDKGVPIMKVFKDSSGNDKLGFFIFRQPTGPAEFIFGRAKFTNTDTIRYTVGANDAIANAIEELSRTNSDYELLNNVINGINLRDVDKYNYDVLLKQMGSDRVEELLIASMQHAKAAGKYQYQTLSNSMMELLSRTKKGSPLELTSSMVKDMIDRGMDAKELFPLYTEGNVFRIFAKSGAFDDLGESTRAKVSSILGSDAAGLPAIDPNDATSMANYNKALQAKLLDPSISQAKKDQIMSMIGVNYSERMGQSIVENSSLGGYINRLTFASSSMDQERDILDEVTRRGGIGDFIKSRVLENNRLAILDPSQAVDFVVNFGDQPEILADAIKKAVGMSMSEESIDKALEEIYGKIQLSGGNLNTMDAIGQYAARTKGRRMGALRAAAIIQGITDEDLMASYDAQIVMQRLKGEDVFEAAGGHLEGFNQMVDEAITELSRTGQSLTPSQIKMIEEQREILSSISEGTNDEVQANIARLMGLGENSKYAHLTKLLNMGNQIKNMNDSLFRNVYARSAVPFLSEINLDDKAINLAQNIVNQYLDRADDLAAGFDGAFENIDAMSANAIYKKVANNARIGDEILQSIEYGAKETGASVQDILSNIERIAYGSDKRARRMMSLRSGVGADENKLQMLFTAATEKRRLQFLKRQEGVEQLLNSYEQYHGAWTKVKGRSQQQVQKELIEAFRVNVGMKQSASSLDIMGLAFGMGDANFNLGDFTESMRATGLSEQEIQRSVIKAQQLVQGHGAQRYLDESGLDDFLTFGNRPSAQGFAPPDIGLTDSQKSALLEDASNYDVDMVEKTAYQRLSKSFREGKLGEAFGNPIVKKSAYALAGLVAASLIYSSTKDRTEEGIAGPPLLPGGSAYEQMVNREPNIPPGSMFSGYNQGTSYSINMEGTEDQMQSLSSAIGSVTGSSINSTIYKGLPTLGRDPYSQLAGSF